MTIFFVCPGSAACEKPGAGGYPKLVGWNVMEAAGFWLAAILAFLERRMGNRAVIVCLQEATPPTNSRYGEVAVASSARRIHGHGVHV